MDCDDLQQFITALEQADELARVASPVDPHLEVAAIVNAVCKGRGRNVALLFENVTGHVLPLAANLFGTDSRIELALGSGALSALPDRLRRDLAAADESCAVRALQAVVSKAPTRALYVDSAACFATDGTGGGLGALPALQCWPGDGGRYLTLGQVFTCHPETQACNCGMYRVQLLDNDRALLRCHAGSGGAQHLDAWRARGEAMPVAIALGGPPMMTWLAGVSLPGEIAEADFAGYLRGRAVNMARCRDTRLAVPASAEIVIEGLVHPNEEFVEGPFGNHTGWYAPASPAPVVQVERISMRVGAVYPCTVVGPPPMENIHLAELAGRTLLPLLQFDHPWVADLHMPPEGIYHRAAMVAVAEDCPPSVEAIAEALWCSALLKNSRLLVLLDRGAPLMDRGEIYWRLINSKAWPAIGHLYGERLVIDARTPPGVERVVADRHIEQQVMQRWQEYGL